MAQKANESNKGLHTYIALDVDSGSSEIVVVNAQTKCSFRKAIKYEELKQKPKVS